MPSTYRLIKDDLPVRRTVPKGTPGPATGVSWRRGRLRHAPRLRPKLTCACFANNERFEEVLGGHGQSPFAA